MSNNLSAIEEFDAQRKIQLPHLIFKSNDLRGKKNIAYMILTRSGGELLAISPAGFGATSVIAGFTDKSMEYFAKNAPLEYRKNFLDTINNDYLVDDIFNIAKSMDDDEGDGSSKNQNRINLVLKYARDNVNVF